MSTRGSISFVANGETKTCYNHSDSYPEWLGDKMVSFLADTDLDELPGRIAALTVVDEDSKPSPEQVAQLDRYANPGVGGPITNTVVETWYQLLRGTQGDPEAILDSGFLLDASTFPADSLFCEWGYVIDTDARVFEVYRGFQTEPHEEGRFASMPRDGEYYPIRLVKSWSFDERPDEEDFAAWAKAYRLEDRGGIGGALRERSPLTAYHVSVIEKIEDEDTPEDARAALDRLDDAEIADYIDESVPEGDEDEWAEAALSEFGFEGCGESMSGIRSMARYVYNRHQTHLAKRDVTEWLDDLISELA